MSVNIGEQRRKLQSGFRTVQASAVVTLHQCLVSGSPSTSTRRNPAYELLWETICRPDSSAFLAASCADVIVRLVLNGKLDWMDASDDFINAATSASTTAVPYLVRGIADLLVVHLRSIDVRDYTCPFKLSSRRVHPFIGFAKARPDALLDILEQSKRIVSLIPVHQSMERRALLSMLHPWVQYVFVQSALRRLMIHGEFQSLLLDILSECATDAASVVYLVHEVLSLLDRIPLAMDDSGTMHITLLEFAVGHLSGLEKNEGLKVEVLYRCLNHAFDCRQIGRSVLFALAYVRQLLMEEHVILQDCIVSTNLLAASGYLLLQTPEYADEGAVLVELLLHIVKYANLDCRGVQQILPVLFCPLLQALSECTNIRVKNKGYDLLAILERSLEKQGDVQCQQPHRGCSAARGPFGAIVHKTQDLLMQRSQKWNTYSAIPFLNTFLSCSLIFQPSEEVRLAALSAVVSNAELSPDECLSLLPLLLYALRKERSQRVQIHILLKTLPALTSANNPFVTARVLRLAQSLLGDVQAMGAGTIASVGLRCMFEVWKRQPRTWHQFKGYLVAWAKRRRYGRPANWNSHGKWGDELEMELCTTTCFRDVCLLRGEDCGPEILPHLFILLSAPELHPLSAVFALEALNHCIKLDVTDPRAAWNVFMSSYATVATGGAHEDIIIRVCQFFELVPQRDDHSEIYTAFKEDILGRLHPLTSHSAQAVRAAAFAALGKFDPPDLFALLDQPRVLVGSVLSEPDYPGGVSLLLPSLIRHEVKYMRRAVFKGLSVESGVNSRVDESTQVHGALAPLRRMIKSTLDEVRGLWESGRASVGVRSGYAACCLLVPSNTNASLSASEINVKKLPTYRPLTNALRDITLKDHIFVRLEAVPTWIRFWQSLLVWSYQQSESEEFAVEGIEEKQKRLTVVERIFAAVHEDLMVRLKESRLPSLSSNIVLSLTALELAGVAAGLAVANDAAAKTVDFLLEEYVDKGASDANSNTNEVTENDEIQYAVHVALGHLASALHSNDEQRLSSIYTQLLAGSCRVKRWVLIPSLEVCSLQ
ncbi:hypothetical protein BC832DRAFT_357411 [Gaertneriomyces semiglobifer]|nr:hypothetical protein BC832DRAFT_357411 [Gaertneriomyces semiglobifer]